jgi:hypothetical protein
VLRYLKFRRVLAPESISDLPCFGYMEVPAPEGK